MNNKVKLKQTDIEIEIRGNNGLSNGFSNHHSSYTNGHCSKQWRNYIRDLKSGSSLNGLFSSSIIKGWIHWPLDYLLGLFGWSKRIRVRYSVRLAKFCLLIFLWTSSVILNYYSARDIILYNRAIVYDSQKMKFNNGADLGK